jgi:hypothetical protein
MNALRKQLDEEFGDFIGSYMVENELEGLISTPYIRYAAADNPEFDRLKEIVHSEHYLP